MATRSSRKTTTKTTSSRIESSASSGRETPQDVSSISASSSVTSPVSPTRRSRIEEKQQLCNLNDRLACYIEKVRNLENQNANLELQLRDIEVTETRDRSKLVGSYEAELSDARRLLDETAKQKAKLQIEADKHRAENEDLKNRFAKLERDFKQSETNRMNADSLVQDLQARLNTADSRAKHFEDEAKKLRAYNADLQKQLDTARRQLEEETVLRVDLENRLQSLREELAFNKQMSDQQMEETRRRRQTEVRLERKELEGEYKEKLQEALHQMREQFDSQLGQNRQEIEDMYEGKLRDANDYASSNRAAASEAREELSQMRSQIDSMEKERNQYEGQVGMLERKIKDLQDQLRTMRDDYTSRLGIKDEEIQRLRIEVGKMMVDYQDLMDTKVQLDVEIEAYRRLLEGEEERLHITASEADLSSSSTSRRGIKRKRVLQEHEDFETTYKRYSTQDFASGHIQIEEHDTDGMYVKLRNNSDKNQSIGGWSLKRTGSGAEVSYKFHSRQSIKAGETLTIWSSNSNATHSPPTDLVMKNQTWPVGERIRSFMLNNEAEEVAWRESKMVYGSGLASGLEAAEADQRCVIM